MPSRERVVALVAMVEQGGYVEEIEEFYAEVPPLVLTPHGTAPKM